MVGGEVYVKKIPSMSILELARAVAPKCTFDFVGIRPGEKLHEEMISEEDALNTYEYPDYFKILPVINNWNQSSERIKDGKHVPTGFRYSSDNNKEWMTQEELRDWLSGSGNKAVK
jgi:FlaA1/EpsC-like NDP-sugar epimerase